jgi:hypothetical protein
MPSPREAVGGAGNRRETRRNDPIAEYYLTRSQRNGFLSFLPLQANSEIPSEELAAGAAPVGLA